MNTTEGDNRNLTAAEVMAVFFSGAGIYDYSYCPNSLR
jgi:hypothetical protein